MDEAEWWIANDDEGNREVVKLIHGRIYMVGYDAYCSLHEYTVEMKCVLIRPLDISRGSDDAVCMVDTANEQEQVE